MAPKLKLLFTTQGLSAQPYLINFSPYKDLILSLWTILKRMTEFTDALEHSTTRPKANSQAIRIKRNLSNQICLIRLNLLGEVLANLGLLSSTEEAFLLPTQQPGVKISALLILFLFTT